MGRPIYTHTEGDSSVKKSSLECRTWQGFARRLEGHPYLLRDPAATLDANTAPLRLLEAPVTRETGVASQTTDSGGLPGLMMAPPLADSEDEWEALQQDSYTPLLASGAGPTTRSAMADDPGPRAIRQGGELPPEGMFLRTVTDDAGLPEWPTPTHRMRRGRRAAGPSDGNARGWTPSTHAALQNEPSAERVPELWHLMRRELLGTSVGQRASGNIATVQEGTDEGRSYTALQMARHAARDLLRQLDVRIAESRARNQRLRADIGNVSASGQPQLVTLPLPLEMLGDTGMTDSQE